MKNHSIVRIPCQPFVLFVLAMLFFSGPILLSGENQPCLLIVDVQNFYFPGGKLPLVGCDAAAQNARKILELFRQMQWPIVHVRHLPQNMSDAPLSGDPQWSFQSSVMPLPGETVVTKHEVNSFRGTNLSEILGNLKIKNLVIVGMQTHMCLEGAVRAAADQGFLVTVADDACATRDLEYNGKKIPAEQVHLSTLASLKGTYARILATSKLLEELNSPSSPAPVK